MIEPKLTVKPDDFVLDFRNNAQLVAVGHYFQGVLEGGQELQRLL